MLGGPWRFVKLELRFLLTAELSLFAKILLALSKATAVPASDGGRGFYVARSSEDDTWQCQCPWVRCA